MMVWHASRDVLTRFATSPERIDDITAASVEEHLVACAECRAVVAAASDVALIAASWDAVADAIDRPRATLVERVVRPFGVSAETARLVGATTALQLAWLASILGLSAASVLAARQADSAGPFLAVAPIVPLLAVMCCFLPIVDPGGEAGTATPMFGAGLVLRRVVAVLVPTVVLLLLAGAALPGAGTGAAWLLPGLALAMGALALSTVVRVSLAAGGLATGWMGLVFWHNITRGDEPFAQTMLFGPTGQLVSLALAAGATAVVVLRRDRFSTLEVTW